MTQNSLLTIYSSIDEKVKSREDVDASEEGKERHSVKSIRRRDITPITGINDEIFHHNLKIDELNRKIEFFGNDVYNIKWHKYKVKKYFSKVEKIEIEQNLVYKIEYVRCFKCIISNEKLGLVVQSEMELILKD